MAFDVVGFGALNLDKLFKVNLIAKAEEEGFVTDFKESGGGSAANTIVGLARLGLQTGFVGKVAADKEGKIRGVKQICLFPKSFPNFTASELLRGLHD